MPPEGAGEARDTDKLVRGFVRETARDSGYRKAARFLMLLGKEEASRVLSHMSPQEVEGIAKEIARTQNIEKSEATKLLEEFGYIKETKEGAVTGGLERAEDMLVAAIGAERAEKILEKVRKEMAPPPFAFLQDLEAHQAIGLVRAESAPVASLILAHLEPKLAARILQALEPQAQREVVTRIAKMREVSPEVIQQTEEALRKKVREQGEVVTQEVDGKGALTEILRFMDPSKEKAILEDLDPNLSTEIRKKLFTIDVVFHIADKVLQRILRDYADRELALILKGVGEAVSRRLGSALSERRSEFIQLEMKGIGAVPKRDADRAIEDFLDYLQLLEQKGELEIMRDGEHYV